MKNNLFDNYLKRQVFEEEDKYIDILNNITKILTEEKIKFDVKDLERKIEKIVEDKKQELLSLITNEINILNEIQKISDNKKMYLESNLSDIILLKLKEKI
jgi:hypothetical protein